LSTVVVSFPFSFCLIQQKDSLNSTFFQTRGSISDQSIVGIARFINETSNADFIAKVIGKNVVFSKKMREFNFRSGLFQAHRLELEGVNASYKNNGEIQVATLLLNQNMFRNNNILTAIKVEGSAGSLINRGTFATKGETTFHTLENKGTTYFEKLVIDGQGINEGELRIHSLNGKGHLGNHGKLIFLHQPAKAAQIKIAYLTNETKGDSTNDAAIHGTDVVISAAMKSLTLKQGKVLIKNLTFAGGKIAYENKGEITAEVLTLTQLQQPFVNSHIMTIDILAVNTPAGFTNQGDLQLGSLTMGVDLLDAAPVIPNFINRGNFLLRNNQPFMVWKIMELLI
jgi:hypothetical protein